jgi:Replication-relaxation
MATQKFSKFIRPEAVRPGPITDRDLDILDAVLRYRFCSAAQIARLAGGNEDVTHRRLRRLWERGLVTRWAFPGFRTHSEFYYYLDSRTPLDLLAERRRLEIHPQMLDEIRAHREKDYAGAAVRGQHMQLGFLNHGLMVARIHFMIEMACRRSVGAVSLEAWCQGGQLAGHKVEVPKVRSSKTGGEFFWQEVDETKRLPVEPDALFTLRFPDRPEGHQLVHFCYEADRGSMVMTDMLKKFRGYHHFIKKQQKHREAFHVHPIRAVLVETTEEARGKKLMELVGHPLVAGPAKRAGLFWLSISPLFTDPAPGSSTPRYLDQPEAILEPIWALPDRSLHALSDAENTHSAPSQATAKTARLTDSGAQL